MQSATGLINRVRGIVGDKSLVPRIFEHLNDGLAHIVRTVRPPDLQDIATVTVPATEQSVAMPTDFFGPRIFSAKNITTGEIIKRIYYRNAEFFRDFPEMESGHIEAVLVRGNTMAVACVPQSDEDIQIKYLARPTYFASVDDNGSLITYLPDRLGEKALVMYAVMEEYRIIEDGVDGDKRNMLDAQKTFLEIMAEIMAHYGTENLEDGGPVVAYDALGLLTGNALRDTLWGRL